MLHLRPPPPRRSFIDTRRRVAPGDVQYAIDQRGSLKMDSTASEGTISDGTMAHHRPLQNELQGSWNTLTGQSQMLTGAQLADPDLFVSGVISALQGQLQEAIGDRQAQVAGEAMRTQWNGLSRETKGEILTRWAQWTNDPDAMAQGVADLMQGKLERYAGSTARQMGTPLSDAGVALSDDAAARARKAMAALFAARNP